ncbi:DUF397 domain-containing protein [Streptomyces sp. NBC_00289]|uniref:DUF397 domain-containing protein n=1 Tax=Streptomyces sp. NBC_00289 TaxID=2975703 RepID=UPI0032432ADA
MSIRSAADDGSELNWSKSSYSSNEPGSDCIEIAPTPETVHVRDSKDRTRTHLAFATGPWTDFVTHTAGR